MADTLDPVPAPVGTSAVPPTTALPESTVPPIVVTPRRRRTAGSVARATPVGHPHRGGSPGPGPVARLPSGAATSSSIQTTMSTTVAPLAHKPRVQDVIVAQVDERIQISPLDVEAYVKQVLTAEGGHGCWPPRSKMLFITVVHTLTTRVVQSKAFYTLWVTINRVAHKQIVTLLTGRAQPGQVIVIRSGKSLFGLVPGGQQSQGCTGGGRHLCRVEAPGGRSDHRDR